MPIFQNTPETVEAMQLFTFDNDTLRPSGYWLVGTTTGNKVLTDHIRKAEVKP